MWHDFLLYGTWRLHMCNVPRLFLLHYITHFTQSHMTHSNISPFNSFRHVTAHHDSFIWLILLIFMTYDSSRHITAHHDSFIWLILLIFMTYDLFKHITAMWHDFLLYGTCCVHMCDVTRLLLFHYMTHFTHFLDVWLIQTYHCSTFYGLYLYIYHSTHITYIYVCIHMMT